ncbi:unnamed protein product [Bemisia tabaci]|uniref:Uncharacterized protein n=1 Tax=Bemisia tabaci TaxID=7038 RepID=A0A9P0AFE7_BEMTA|nr:unnamed protein product [Bemisia tabaci]
MLILSKKEREYITEYAWILTRDVCPDSDAIRKAMLAFRINGIATRPLMRTGDNVCFPEDTEEDDYDW